MILVLRLVLLRLLRRADASPRSLFLTQRYVGFAADGGAGMGSSGHGGVGGAEAAALARVAATERGRVQQDELRRAREAKTVRQVGARVLVLVLLVLVLLLVLLLLLLLVLLLLLLLLLLVLLLLLMLTVYVQVEYLATWKAMESFVKVLLKGPCCEYCK